MTQFHLVQTSLAWENAAENRALLEKKIMPVAGGVIILPEMFSTGFSMASERLAEPMTGETIAWMKQLAVSTGSNLCGSVIIEDGGRRFNRFLWTTPEGSLTYYDKRHLFRMADEHQHYAAGEARVLVDAGTLRLMPQVCYDLRFPAWSRNGTGPDQYDVLLYVANWPAARRAQWIALLKARAIENLCYVIGVNRIGTDGNEVAYAGDSCVFDPTGETLLDLGDQDRVGSIELDKGPLQVYRESFPAHLDADQLKLS